MATKIIKSNQARNIQSSNVQTGQLKGQLNNGIKPLDNMSLNDLSDVNITSPEEADIVFYDGNSWVNENIADAMDTYVWVLDGCGEYSEEPTPEPEPEPEPEFDSYAEELSSVLGNFINGEEFQNYVKPINGLDNINMTGNAINLTVSDKFPSIIETIFNDGNVSRMVGRIITTVYDNISGEIRQIMDDIETDMWIAFKNATSGSAYNAKIFAYMSDSSVVFYDIIITFN